MTTDSMLRSEASYRTERAASRGAQREVARLSRTLVRVSWRARQLTSAISAARRAHNVDAGVRDALAVGVHTDWPAGRA